MRIHKRVSVSMALAALAFGGAATVSRPAMASEMYTAGIQKYLGLACAPQCIVCHTTNAGGFGTVTRQFGINIKAAADGLPGTAPGGVFVQNIDVLNTALERLRTPPGMGGAGGMTVGGGGAGGMAIGGGGSGGTGMAIGGGGAGGTGMAAGGTGMAAGGMAAGGMAANGRDSDGDGIFDIQELINGTDPNSPANASLCGSGPTFGCGATIAKTPEKLDGTAAAAALLTALIGLLALRRRA